MQQLKPPWLARFLPVPRIVWYSGRKARLIETEIVCPLRRTRRFQQIGGATSRASTSLLPTFPLHFLPQKTVLDGKLVTVVGFDRPRVVTNECEPSRGKTHADEDHARGSP